MPNVNESIQTVHTQGNIVSFKSTGKVPIRSMKVWFNPVQSGSGDPSPSNVRSISGRIGVNVKYGSKNVFNSDEVIRKDGYIYTSNGEESVSSTGTAGYTVNYVDLGITCNQFLIIGTSEIAGYNNTFRIYCYDENKNWILRTASLTQTNNAIVVGGSGLRIRYIRIQYNITNVDFSTIDIRAAKTNLDADWSSEAGTLYGGYVDLISGQLVQTHKYVLLNNPDDWTEGTRAYFYKDGLNYFDDRKIDDSDLADSGHGNTYGLTCSIAIPDTSTDFYCRWTSKTSYNFAFRWPSTNTSAPTLEDIKTLASNNNISVVYELDTPIIYQLTPLQLSTLIGQNTIWSNSNSIIEVEYDLHEPADVMAWKRRFAMNEPHLETKYGQDTGITTFITDMKAPLKSCIVRFNPIQNGYGDPSPTNLRNFDAYDGITLSYSGSDTLDTTDITINWRDNQGLLYGGYIDLVKGELVSEYAYFGKKWGEMTTYKELTNCVIKRIGLADQCDNNSEHTYCNFSNNFLVDYTTDEPHYFVRNAGSSTIMIMMCLPKNFGDDKTVHFIYKRATPRIYSLTPQQLKTLRGENNFWSGTNASTTVQYWSHKNVTLTPSTSRISPSQLQAIAASGNAANYYNIGDEIIIPWTDYSISQPKKYQMPFIVVDIADCYDENDQLHENAIWLMSKYTLPYTLPMSAAQNIEVDLTNEPNAVAGWYYYYKDGSSYVALNLNTGDAIPTTYDAIYKSIFNSSQIVRRGYSRWSYSLLRQWLNSNSKNNWWTSQYQGEAIPNTEYTSKPSWLSGFSSDWKSIFKPIKVQTYVAADGILENEGVIDTTYDKFFLPSSKQAYSASYWNAEANEKYWPYWKNIAKLDSPSDDANSNRIVKDIINFESSTCRFRTTGSAMYGTMMMNNFGSIFSGGSAYATTVSYLPSCVIY